VTFDVTADAYDRFMGRFSEPLAEQFVGLADLTAGQRALDVGCGPGALTARLVERLGADAVAGVDPSASFVAAARGRFPGVDVRQARAEELPFPDGAFDVVFSNAVVEHVGGRDRQRKLVTEALRVGRRAFITTPNRRFPIELHTRLPLVHWLPDEVSHRAYRATGKEFATDVHLLTRRSFRDLFPGRVRIVSLGLTLVAIVD